MDAQNLNQLWAALIIEEMIRVGIHDFIIAPGSRNAPLTVAALRHPRARTLVHYDERGAAFLALGFGRMNRPAAVICTSGSAVANCYPAVVEAAQSALPLIILSADRPPELHDCGANQTMDQHTLFGRHAREFVMLPCPDAAIAPEALLAKIDAVLARAFGCGVAGPVHINCMYREPLAPDTVKNAWPGDYQRGLERWRKTDAPYATWHSGVRILAEEQMRALCARLSSVRHGLLIIGRLYTEKERDAVIGLAQKSGWPVFADITSGCRNARLGHNAIHYYDLMLAASAFQAYCQPECVLHIGDTVVSKRLQQHLAEIRTEYLHLSDRPEDRDPVHRVTRRFQANITHACRQLVEQLPAMPESPVLEQYREMYREACEIVRNTTASRRTLTEILIAGKIADRVEQDTLVYVGNSMPVRVLDMVVASCAATTVHANRGVSGIDGNIATAAGMARASGKRTVAVIGDTTALHDLNSLALLNTLPVPLLLVIINNGGGGIFSYLPIARHSDVIKQGFINPHPWQFKHAALMFDIPYAGVTGASAFEEALDSGFSSNCPMIIEAIVDHDSCIAHHNDMLSSVAALTCRPHAGGEHQQ